jgi:DNA-binding transcriptional ArsR family regulator
MTGEAAVVDDTSLLAALNHPLRREILAKMGTTEAPLSPRELSEDLGEPLSNVSYHVRVLNQFEIIGLARTRPVRGTMQHFYRADPEVLAIAWVRSMVGLG